MTSAADGVIVGLGHEYWRMACNRCEWVGTPLEFDADEARVAYEVACGSRLGKNPEK